MLDVFNTIAPSTANYQEFYYTATSSASRQQTWNKPRGASMVRILVIGSGGGGSNGFTGRSTGGAGGAVISLLIPALLLPDSLYIVAGRGGAGGLASNTVARNGSAGDFTGAYTLDGTGIIIASGGNGGTSSGGTGVTPSISNLGSCGVSSGQAGQNGASADTSITLSTTTFLSGGAGGSTTTTGLGANVPAQFGYPTVSGGATSGANGENGYFRTQPIMLGTGGAGGAGNASGAGGNGGNGGLGCGGGGGGFGSTISGAGGNGGNGAVYIWAW
jgi:hypothetical protein